MGQSVAGGKVVKPRCNGIGVHSVTVVLREHVAFVDPAIAIGELQPHLVPFVLLQKFHGFHRQVEVTDVTGFCGAFLNAYAWCND